MFILQSIRKFRFSDSFTSHSRALFPLHGHCARRRSFTVICTKKSSSHQSTTNTLSKVSGEKKLKGVSKSTTQKQQYIEGKEEFGASGKKGKVVAKERPQPPSPPPAESIAEPKPKVDVVKIVTPKFLIPKFDPKDPYQVGAAVSLAAIILLFISAVFQRLVRKKPKTVGPSSDEVWKGRLEETKTKMQVEFEDLLNEELAKKDADAKKQLTDEIGKREANFNAQLASREREVRQALHQEFETQLDIETMKLKQENNEAQNQLELKLAQEYEEQKTKVDDEWKKQIETKELENQQQREATEELAKELAAIKESQEKMQSYEEELSMQLKQYEGLLSDLKESHKTELEKTSNEYESQISSLREEIRSQEEEIARRKRTKEEAQVRANTEAKALAEADEKAKALAEVEAQARAEAEEKIKAASEARAKAEEKARLEVEARVEAEEKARIEAESRAKAEEAARLEAEAREKAEAEYKAKIEEKAAKERAEAEEKARLEAEAKALKEAREKGRLEAEAEAKALVEVQEQARLEAEAKALEEAQEKARLEAEIKALKEAEAKALEQAEEHERREAEAKALKEAEEKGRLEAEVQALKEAHEQARLEAKALKEVEQNARIEAEVQALKAAREKARLEAEARAAAKGNVEGNGLTQRSDFSRNATALGAPTASDHPSASPNGKLSEQPTPSRTQRIQNGRDSEVVLDAEIRIVASGTTIPHVDKVLTGGNDAFFVCSSGCGSIGVADGVGGWGADGVDPSIYSKELMASAFNRLTSMGDNPDALSALDYAHKHAKSPGSATVCLAVVTASGILEVVNLGDCGVRIIRGCKCVFSTEAMYHEFNMPYQLGNPLILTETDWPCNAESYSIELKHGDLIIMGTDGLFDNLWNDELTRLANSFRNHSTDVESAKELANRIAEVAHFNAKQKTVRSPWSVQAAAAGATSFVKTLFPQGGKMDDCTVIVGIANLCE